MPTRRSTSAVAIVISALVLVAGLALTTSRASAMIKVPENTAGLLSIYTDSYPLHYTDMAPGEDAFVRLDIALADADAGDLSLQVRKSGDLATMAGGLEMTVERCEVDWTNVPMSVTSGVAPLCSTGATELLRVDETADFRIASPTWSVDELQNGRVDHLLVTLALPVTTSLAAVEGRSADFGFGLFASGLEDIAVVTPPSLAFTGFDALYLALVAVGTIGIGIAVRLRRPLEDDVRSVDLPEVTE